MATDRIAGEDRYETAAKLADANDATECDSCPTDAHPVVASGETFADALTVANFIYRPILLTQRDSIPPATWAYLQKYAAKGGSFVIIAGGTAAVSDAVEQKIRSLGLSPERVAGNDRYETSASIGLVRGRPLMVLLASGEQFPDALAAGPIVAQLRYRGSNTGLEYGLLLTPSDHLASGTKRYLLMNPSARVIIVGGESAVSAQVQRELGANYFDRIAGVDRFDTAAKLADYLAENRGRFGKGPIKGVFLASGQSFADALASAGVAARNDATILLAGPTTLPSATRNWVAGHAADIAKVTAVGGRSSVSDEQLQHAAAAATT